MIMFYIQIMEQKFHGMNIASDFQYTGGLCVAAYERDASVFPGVLIFSRDFSTQ